MEAPSLLETGFAAVLLAAAFVVGERTHLLGRLLTPRSLTSFGGGMAAAYVFLHVMPELHGARHAFTEAAAMALPYEGKAIYYLALAGFLSFYGIRHFHTRQLSAREGKPDRLDFQVQIGGFAAYAWLMGYLLLRGLEAHHIAIGLYAVAMAFHCLAINRELSHEYGNDYRRTGRFILAGMALAGWASAALLDLPASLIPLLLAFLSGAVIMNSLILELPTEKDGRFWPFITGGLLYGLILLPLG
ncbi:MAG TPA: hypothetical protein PKX14_10515 [Thauera aminoaromatica]|nr:hypothetical protein [Thauera aminoaromatica]HMV92876.1 hypothetical protein [Thauera aminoaromatica]HMX13925.1 hypothetical protein [Thauera aminoaromatica]HMY78769.1 hypothetical protein [Thauera aminoaromatica]HMZ29496.1 hypothetical protein [Thauera aminoaromatica]